MGKLAATGIIAFGCVVVVYAGRALRSRSSYPLPPGPPGLPWVGNVIGFDAGAPWITYSEWAKTYGDIIYSRLFGKNIIVINSENIARDLLESRSRNYSDRPHQITNEMCGLDFHSALLPYGDKWRLHRRFFHQTFRLDAVHRFLPYQHRRACIFLKRLLDDPEQVDDHAFEYAASVILNSTYDYDPQSRKDELVDIVASVLSTVVLAVRPDIAVVVGALPLLLYLPSWFPGMSFKGKLTEARTISKRYIEQPFSYSLQRVSSGAAAPSMVHDALQAMNDKGISPGKAWIVALKEASASALLAAAETSHGVLMTFFLIMTLNPDIQGKAQVQIDAVVGKGRLPTVDDRPLLPLVDAIFREVLRFSPIVPLSAPHAVVNDDVYNGYFIPKGSIIITNLWSMAHDESRYPDSHAFIPERFLNEDGSLKPSSTEHIAFGFGRRMCVGRHFADVSVWGAIAKALAMFKILKPLDADGREIHQEPNFTSGLAIHPLPFKCRIVPRFPGMDAEKLGQLIAASTL